MADHPTGKDIFRECCSRIAVACAPFGFKYYKSRRSIIKNVGSLRLRCFSNISGTNIAAAIALVLGSLPKRVLGWMAVSLAFWSTVMAEVWYMILLI